MAPKASDASAADSLYQHTWKNFVSCFYGFSQGWKSLFNTAVYVIKLFTKFTCTINFILNILPCLRTLGINPFLKSSYSCLRFWKEPSVRGENEKKKTPISWKCGLDHLAVNGSQSKNWIHSSNKLVTVLHQFRSISL